MPTKIRLVLLFILFLDCDSLFIFDFPCCLSDIGVMPLFSITTLCICIIDDLCATFAWCCCSICNSVAFAICIKSSWKMKAWSTMRINFSTAKMWKDQVVIHVLDVGNSYMSYNSILLCHHHCVLIHNAPAYHCHGKKIADRSSYIQWLMHDWPEVYRSTNLTMFRWIISMDMWCW